MCSCSSTEKMFKLHVTDADFLNQESIKYFKDPVMHGPLFFKFVASSVFLDEIVRRHSLEEIDNLPRVIKSINTRPEKEKITWWPNNQTVSEFKKHCIWYTPKNGVGDWEMRCLYQGDTNAYFVSSGIFDTKRYVITPLTAEELW